MNRSSTGAPATNTLFERALIRHALTVKSGDGRPIFDCCVSSLRNFNMFEENVGAASPKVAEAEGFELLRHA